MPIILQYNFFLHQLIVFAFLLFGDFKATKPIRLNIVKYETIYKALKYLYM